MKQVSGTKAMEWIAENESSVMNHAVDMAQEIIRLRTLKAELVKVLEDVLACPESNVAKRVARAALDKVKA